MISDLWLLQRDQRKGAWDVIVDMPTALSFLDVELVKWGIQLYTSFAADKVLDRDA